MNIAEKLTTISNNMQGIYDKGFSDGQAQGGGDNYYDTFWDNFQRPNNTLITALDHLFRSASWNDTTFNPKYKMYPISANSTFQYTGIQDGSKITDCIDFKNCLNVNNLFYGCSLTKNLGVLDFSKVNRAMNSTFYGMTTLESIEKIIIDGDSGISYSNNTFQNVSKLKEIRFEGKILSTINFSYCTQLSVDSIKNIIDALDDYSDPMFSGSMKLTLPDECWNRIEASGAVPNGYNTWRDYVETGKGWLT